ncbi:hypothetical protein OS493_020547 [Desmophyllum pertusum]|uniref:Uncharacterized protein n=1 Tax=Desmophyllum pertusum TaxID=174260 RepID=A0A9W9YZ14_9CNID|nr:hypothetical protein OS493_020547 [Desmophyllum pertusum]
MQLKISSKSKHVTFIHIEHSKIQISQIVKEAEAFACTMLPSAPVNLSVSKDDISGSDRPSTVAVAGVRLIPLSSRLLRVLWVKLAAVFTSAVQQCA